MEWPTVSAYTTSTVQKSTEYELEDRSECPGHETPAPVLVLGPVPWGKAYINYPLFILLVSSPSLKPLKYKF